MKPRIYVNAATCSIGGGAQVAANFIRASLSSSKYDFEYGISPAVKKHLAAFDDCRGTIGRVFDKPSSPVGGCKARRELRNAIREYRPDAVFTIFGPAYLDCGRRPHLIGMADPWITHARPDSYGNHSIIQKILTWGTAQYKAMTLSRSSFYWAESDTVKEGLERRIGVSADRIWVVPNTCADLFRVPKKSFSINKHTLRIALIAADYPHKNLLFVPRVAREMRTIAPHVKVVINTTLESSSSCAREMSLFLKKNCPNVKIFHNGPQDLYGCRKLYSEADIVIQPSLLEAFSATYAEAICMGVPLFASDLPFAKSACGDAAIYFNPQKPSDCAEKIISFVEDKSAQLEQLRKMSRKSEEFLSENDRFIQFDHIFQQVLNRD